MIDILIRDNILNNLEKLPLDLQKKVQDFVNALVITMPKGVSGSSLVNYSAKLDKNDATEILNIIEEGCEKVDLNEW